MQEVSVKPRSVFKHAVIVQEHQAQELQYSFNTRKNNIKFGIYKREAPEGRAVKSVARGDSATSPAILTFGEAAQSKSFEELMAESGLVAVLPVAHYQSSKYTINGSHHITEPGVYYLVFDNTFSVQTPKKLFFSLSVKDIEPTQTVVKKEIEGWILKKGNRAMQGYQKRWAVVESNGVLTYYKTPGSTCRGYASLKTAAVHVDHNHRLVDIDTGAEIFHFKVGSRSDFRLWTAVIEKHTESKSAQRLADGAPGSHLTINGNVATEMDSDAKEMNAYLARILSSLSGEIDRMRQLVEASRGRIDSKSSWKDFANILASTVTVAESLADHVKRTEEYVGSYHSNILSYREQVTSAFQTAESAFLACLKDNNRIREQFGLESTQATDFIPAGFEHMSLFSAITGRTRNGSTMSSDQYFDAEEIRNDDSDDSASSSAEEEEDNSTGEQADSGDESDQTKEPSSPVKHDISSLPTPVEGAPKMAMVKFRSALPHPTVSMENISVMGLLRNNVGKDLSKVAMPIALNEPLNLLQRLCEELEYCELLDQASKTEDPVKRLCLLAGFAVSGYSSTIHRAGRKPFNPLLGETYEMVREDKGFKFMSEKVSHHPPVMACYAESPNYAFYQDSMVKSKFWGKSMELSPSGTVHVKLNGVDDEYTWNKVTTSMRNIFSAGRYLEHHGSVIIKSLKTGHSCELQFKESGYFSSAQNEVTGTISDASGKKVLNLSGRWDHSLSFFTDAAPNSLEVIWRAKAHPANFRENYGFTQFAIELNELIEDMKPVLPKTDTRFRPDQRLYENGKCDEADKEKERLENKQREARKVLESQGGTYSPKWFEQKGEGDSAYWSYKGGYFEKRGQFGDNLPQLW